LNVFFFAEHGLLEDPVDPHEIDPYYNGFDIDMGDDDDEVDVEDTEVDDDDDHMQKTPRRTVMMIMMMMR
jgi:hypothetical protein